jgi:hypothetical protein
MSHEESEVTERVRTRDRHVVRPGSTPAAAVAAVAAVSVVAVVAA